MFFDVHSLSTSLFFFLCSLLLHIEQYGSAVYIDGASGTFTNCSWIGNFASSMHKDGGVVYIKDSGSATFTSCSWTDNSGGFLKVSATLFQIFFLLQQNNICKFNRQNTCTSQYFYFLFDNEISP